MYAQSPQRQRHISRIDPACAICSAPPAAQCDCEANALNDAVAQAEEQMMEAVYSNIREWVQDKAKDYILSYFSLLSEARKDAHSANLDHLKAQAYYHRNGPPTPHEIAEVDALHRRGIDEDWKASVQRYPEVLQYYFSLINYQLPKNNDPAVRDPPLSALSGQRKRIRRNSMATPHPPPLHSGPPVGVSSPFGRSGPQSGGGGGGGFPHPSRHHPPITGRPPISYRYPSTPQAQGQFFPPTY